MSRLDLEIWTTEAHCVAAVIFIYDEPRHDDDYSGLLASMSIGLLCPVWKT